MTSRYDILCAARARVEGREYIKIFTWNVLSIDYDLLTVSTTIRVNIKWNWMNESNDWLTDWNDWTLLVYEWNVRSFIRSLLPLCYFQIYHHHICVSIELYQIEFPFMCIHLFVIIHNQMYFLILGIWAYGWPSWEERNVAVMGFGFVSDGWNNFNLNLNI